LNRRYAMIAFGILLIGYSVFVVWSIIQYTAYCNRTLAWLEAIGIPKGIVEPKPYTFFWYGQATIILGLTLLFAGIIIVSERSAERTALS